MPILPKTNPIVLAKINLASTFSTSTIADLRKQKRRRRNPNHKSPLRSSSTSEADTNTEILPPFSRSITVTMPIAPITGRLKKGLVLDLSVALGMSTT
ncbi:hypothetical protein TWF132_005416 [Orbilia oligospora]|nr:hypothetical protein TWF132_005416 [Orbilia oligospora]